MHSGDLRPALELARAAPDDADSVVTPDGKRFGVRRLKPGLELSAEEGAWSRVLWFPPVEERPSALPDDVPFLPGLETTVTVRKEKLLTQWALADVDPARVADSAFNKIQAARRNTSKRREAFQSLGPSPEVTNRLDGELTSLRERLEDEGWGIEEEETREVPFPVRRIVFVRGARKREGARGAIFGLPTLTMRELT